MEIKKDSLCFAEYYFPNDEEKKQKVSLFFVNSAAYYGPFAGWTVYIYGLKQDLISSLSDEGQQLDKVMYHFGNPNEERNINSTIYLGKILSFADVIKKMPYIDRIELENKALIKAAAELVEELGGEVVKILFLMELAGLEGRKVLEGYDVDSVVVYEGK